jgi:hypothetical protein
MKQLGEFKRGDTFAFFANIKDGEENPITGAASKLRCQVRDSLDNLKAELTITEEIGTPGKYLFMALDTSNWPITTITMDIQFNDEGIITSSETISAVILKDVTR